MNNKTKTNLQTVLAENPEIRNWFFGLISRGRKNNISLSFLGGKLVLSSPEKVKSIRLNLSLEILKKELLSSKEEFPIS